MKKSDSPSSTWSACPPGLLGEAGRSARTRVSRRRMLRQCGTAAGVFLASGLAWTALRRDGDGQSATEPLACDVVVPLLPDFVAGRLAADIRKQVESHLKTCAHCSADLRRLQVSA